MFLAFRKYRATDSLDCVEKVISRVLRQQYSTVYVVVRVPCTSSLANTACPYCNTTCDTPRRYTTHDVSFGITQQEGMLCYVDKLYNRPSAANRRRGGDRRWVFVRVPLEECGTSEATVRKLVLPFLHYQASHKAPFDTWGARWGFLFRSTLSLGTWTTCHICFAMTHTAPFVCDRDAHDIERQMAPSARVHPVRKWYCSELALTCLHLVGIAVGYPAQLSTPSNLFRLCEGFQWKACTEPPSRMASSAPTLELPPLPLTHAAPMRPRHGRVIPSGMTDAWMD